MFEFWRSSCCGQSLSWLDDMLPQGREELKW